MRKTVCPIARLTGNRRTGCSTYNSNRDEDYDYIPRAPFTFVYKTGDEER